MRIVLKINSGFEISPKPYNNEKEGDARLNKITAGTEVQIISIKLE